MHPFLASEAVNVLIFDPSLANQMCLTWIWSLELEAGVSSLRQQHQHQHAVSGGGPGSAAVVAAAARCQQQCVCTLQYPCLVALEPVLSLDCFSKLIFFCGSGCTITFYSCPFSDSLFLPKSLQVTQYLFNELYFSLIQPKSAS